MSVELFKKGGSQIFDEFTFTDRLKEGWSLTPVTDESEIIIKEEIFPEMPIDDEKKEISDLEIRHLARDNDIKGWRSLKIDILKDKLGI